MDQATRVLKLAQLLYAGHQVTSRFIADYFQVSEATAKRDVTLLEQTLPVHCSRTDRGGQLNGAIERVLSLPKASR